MSRPKHKSSKSSKGLRSAHDALPKPNVIVCPQCQEPTISHVVCPSCGYYKGKEIVEHKEE